jgi:deoxyribodipyrimidine photo-lyase
MNIFLFHRDLRIVDNTALAKAPKPITPVFIFTDEQIDPGKNKYFSHAAVQFLCESLEDLHDQIKGGLNILHGSGNTLDQLMLLHSRSPIASITQNRDFSVYAKLRDKMIAQWCEKQVPPIAFNNYEDYDLVGEQELLLNDNKPYTVLAAYYNRFIKEDAVKKCVTNKISTAAWSHSNHQPPTITPSGLSKLSKLYEPNAYIAQHGGRKNGLKQLKKLTKSFLDKYDHDRNYPALLESTTQLSAHLKFGTISVRELYWTIVKQAKTKDHPLIRELVFRSFYIKMCTARPGLQRSESFRQDIDNNIPWLKRSDSSYAKLWKAWTEGTTGFPLVDAGMRQLNATGWMHGRVRMVVATVLTRYFLIDWRDGARYFATKLVDYDPCSNNMGWQFSAALGENAQNIYRAPMNPFLQAKTYDNNAEYIKKWVPELAGTDGSSNVSPKQIHTGTWDVVATKYPRPIVDQKEASRKAVALWKSAANGKS